MSVAKSVWDFELLPTLEVVAQLIQLGLDALSQSEVFSG